MCHYATAQVCMNGHAITGNVSNREQLSDYCSYCGAATITRCPNCQVPIRGDYIASGIFFISEYQPPAYCFKCGAPFPWTQARLEAAKALAEEVIELSEDERTLFSDSLPDIITETPRTVLAATRIARILKKLPAAIGSAMYDIFIDVVSDAAKKIIWPDAG